MVSARTFIAAVAAFTAPLVSGSNCTFNSSAAFTLHTEVTKGPEDYNNFYLTSFHVGAALQTVVGTRNASKSIGWVLENSSLQQPAGIFPYNLSLPEEAPVRSSAPSGYDYIDLSYSDSTPGFAFAPTNTSTTSIIYNGNSTDFTGFALCYVNGTAPYFTVGPQYQLLWKSTATTSSYTSCADVDLIAHNIEE